eukprot:TRINITY_DN10794_c0_g1_i2.p1 TRINITY_DN10794_c0_g1~~TRINITY_DN10794_c0_g1_i2.p1  ORF type:complete len:757 (+),score=152.33 TRINITY_DN10794_c0_g1_i2:475-2745(+)
MKSKIPVLNARTALGSLLLIAVVTVSTFGVYTWATNVPQRENKLAAYRMVGASRYMSMVDNEEYRDWLRRRPHGTVGYTPGDHPDWSVAPANATAPDYQTRYRNVLLENILPPAIIGLVITAIVTITLLTVCLCKLCCPHRLPFAPASEIARSKAERLWPLFVLAAVAAIAICPAIIGWIGNSQANKAVNHARAQPELFLQGVNNLVDRFAAELVGLGTDIDNLVEQLAVDLAGLNVIPATLRNASTLVSNTGTELQDVYSAVFLVNANLTAVRNILTQLTVLGIPGIPDPATIPTLGALEASLNSLLNQVTKLASATAAGGLVTAAKAVESINVLIVEQADSLGDAASAALNGTAARLYAIGDEVGAYEQLVEPSFRDFDTFTAFRYITTIIILAWMLLWLFLAVLAGCLQRVAPGVARPLSLLSAIFLSWMLFWCLFFFGIHLGLSRVVADAASNPARLLQNFGAPAALIDLLLCSPNGNVFNQFGLLDFFNVDALFNLIPFRMFQQFVRQFPAQDIINALQPVNDFATSTIILPTLDVPGLDAALDSVASTLNPQQLGAIAEDQVAALLQRVEQITGQVYTVASIVGLDPSQFPDYQAELTDIQATIATYRQKVAEVAAILEEISRIQLQLGLLPTALTPFQAVAGRAYTALTQAVLNVNATLAEFADDLQRAEASIDRLGARIQGLFDVGSCNFANRAYQSIIYDIGSIALAWYTGLWIIFIVLFCLAIPPVIISAWGSIFYGGPSAVTQNV